MLKSFWGNESGASAVEYGLIAALVAVVIITTVTALGGRLSEIFQEITDAL